MGRNARYIVGDTYNEYLIVKEVPGGYLTRCLRCGREKVITKQYFSIKITKDHGCLCKKGFTIVDVRVIDYIKAHPLGVQEIDIARYLNVSRQRAEQIVKRLMDKKVLWKKILYFKKGNRKFE